MAHAYPLSLLSEVMGVANRLHLPVSLSLDKVLILKLALKTKTYLPFLLWDLEEGQPRVWPKLGTCFLSLLKTVPGGSGPREGGTRMRSVQLSSELIH